MSFATIPGGLWYPSPNGFLLTQAVMYGYSTEGNLSTQAIDAADETIVLCGRVSNLSGGSRTISSAGGKIHWRCLSTTWASTTTLRIGLVDVSTTAGPPAQPTDPVNLDVYKDLVRGTDSLAAGIQSTAMATGTKTIADGDAVALVWRLTARGGSDAVRVACSSLSFSGGLLPTQSIYTTSWAQGGNVLAMALIEYDDGTFGSFVGTIPPVTISGSNFTSDSTNPDEWALVFKLPFACEIDALYAMFNSAAAAAGDARIRLYADPSGTPSALQSINLYGEHGNVTACGPTIAQLASSQILNANTEYAVAVKATGSSQLNFGYLQLAAAAHKAAFPHGINASRATRNNDSGSFTKDEDAIINFGVRISEIDTSFAPTLAIGV